jgi:hypothetical protein
MESGYNNLAMFLTVEAFKEECMYFKYICVHQMRSGSKPRMDENGAEDGQD